VPLLSCVRVLIRVRKLRKEIEQFLRHGASGRAPWEWVHYVSGISYLADIFSHFDDLTPPFREGNEHNQS